MRVLINKILKGLHNKSIIKKVLNENYCHKTLNEESINLELVQSINNKLDDGGNTVRTNPKRALKLWIEAVEMYKEAGEPKILSNRIENIIKQINFWSERFQDTDAPVEEPREDSNHDSENEDNEENESDWKEFKNLLIKQIGEDGSYRYGKWRWEDRNVVNGELKKLTRIEEFSIPKDRHQIQSAIPLSDVVESVMKVITSKEGSKIIARSEMIDRGMKKPTNMGVIMKYLVDAKLINLDQIKRMKIGSTLSYVKQKFELLKNEFSVNPSHTPFSFLEFLGFTTLDSLPKEFHSTKKPSEATEYEKSFGNICDGVKYFQVTTGEGNTSTISSIFNYNVRLKNLVNLRTQSVASITAETYNQIVTTETKKYDIKSLTKVTLNGLNTDKNIVLNVGDPIEVKKSPYEDGYHLIEFYGAFKNYTKEQRETYPHMDKFTEVLEGLKEKLQSELEAKSGKGWEIIKSINDVTKGIFFEDYIFVPKDSYELRWSLEGARGYEPRLTIRVDYKEGKPVYKWEEQEGNCNIDTPIKESKTKSTIKKLLKEEFNDLDWIQDTVTAKLSKNENWILVNDIDRESISEGHEIQKYLFDLGYSWGTGPLKNHLKDFSIYTIYHFGNVKNDDHLYYGDGCRSAEVRISDKDIKGGEHMIYYWSDLKPKTIKEENEFDWIRDVEAIKSPKVSENNRYVIWLGELEGYEREQIKDWLFKNLSKCNKKPFTEANFEELAVVTFLSNPCGVGGFKDSVYEDAKDAYQTWSKYMIPLDPQKILKGVNINESQDFDWFNEVKPTLNVAFEEGLIKKGDVLTLSGELTDSEGRFPIQVSDFKVKIEIIRGPDSVWSDISHSFFIPLQEKYFEHLGYNEPESGASIRFANTDGNLEVLDIS